MPAQASGHAAGTPAHNSPSQTVPVYSQTVGSSSVADMYSSGLEWDALNQRIVVADTGNNRIEFYTPGTTPGSWTRTGAFGAFGSAPGDFNSPREVAIDGAGNIYVADAGNSRIQKFDENGNFLWATAPPVGGRCLYTQRNSTCTNQPIGVSWDATNNQLLVADTGDSYIKAFSSAGTWLWTSPPGKTTLSVVAPRDAVRGPGGLVWVSAYTENQIKAFAVSATGVWATTPTVVLGDGVKGGKGPNELIFPYNVAFSPDGTIAYVSDIGNDRIAVYNISNLSDPVWLGAYGKRCNAPCPNPPGDAQEFAFLRRVAVETNGPGAGDVIGDDFWGNGIDIWAPPTGTTLGAFFEQIEGTHAPSPGFAQAYGVTVSPVDGTIYVVDRLNQRIERFTNAGVYENTAGSRGVGVSTFSWPEDAAVAPDGTLWIADTRNSRLEHWNANLTCVAPCTDVGTTGPGVGQFNYIQGVAVDSTGTVWTADTNNNRIESYNPTSHTFATYGSVGTGNCQFEGPQGVAIGPGGLVYVADTGNNRIVEMSVSGGVCTFIATYSTGLSGPQGVAVAGDGTVWVADSGNDNIVHLTSSLFNIGDGFGGLPAGTGNMQFDDPHSLVVYGETLYVADTYNNRIQEYNITGS
jgi:DNA-binding beta-propeller fold protein YncE